MRPRHAMQCIGTNREGNDRMYAAWKLKLVYGQQVWILLADGKHASWKFGHYTQSGARLWDKIEGRWYSLLINWDKGDTIYASQDAMNVIRLYNNICKQSRLKLDLEKIEAESKQLMQELRIK